MTQSPAGCNASCPAASLPAANKAESCARKARRGPAPRANSPFSAPPSAAAAACAASPDSLGAAAKKSRIISPIATPGALSGGANTPSGRFWIGKSG